MNEEVEHPGVTIRMNGKDFVVPKMARSVVHPGNVGQNITWSAVA